MTHPSRVFLARRIPASVRQRLEASCALDPYEGPEPIPRQVLLRRVGDAHGLLCLTERVDSELLDAAPTLRVVANMAAGYDNIDVAACRARGVAVTNAPELPTNACADFTWGLIIGITRRLAEAEREVRRGRWTGVSLDYMLGAELRGTQLGLIGLGRIGRAVAERAPAFGMRVAYYSPRPVTLPGATSMALNDLLASSDVISLHCRLTAETRHLIDRDALARMKRTAYLINVARGPVVDEEALVSALQRREIAGAALDVYEAEPQIHQGLMELENVMLLPHIASATAVTRTAIVDLAVSNVLAVLAGEAPLTPVP